MIEKIPGMLTGIAANAGADESGATVSGSDDRVPAVRHHSRGAHGRKPRHICNDEDSGMERVVHDIKGHRSVTIHEMTSSLNGKGRIGFHQGARTERALWRCWAAIPAHVGTYLPR